MLVLGKLKVPLGIISLTENAMMALMGAMLIFSSVNPQNTQALREFTLPQPSIVQLK